MARVFREFSVQTVSEPRLGQASPYDPSTTPGDDNNSAKSKYIRRWHKDRESNAPGQLGRGAPGVPSPTIQQPHNGEQSRPQQGDSHQAEPHMTSSKGAFQDKGHDALGEARLRIDDFSLGHAIASHAFRAIAKLFKGKTKTQSRTRYEAPLKPKAPKTPAKRRK